MVDGKADSDVSCVRPVMNQANVTLLTGAKVTRLLTGDGGSEVAEVVAEVQGMEQRFRGDVVIVSCGAVNSAALLLRSANDHHPHGLANGSGQVGRNFMRHQNGAILGISLLEENPTVFQKTLAVNDFYWGEADFPYPMGHVQLLGKSNRDMLVGDAPRFTPKGVLDWMARHSVDWWITAEDLPDPRNRVRLDGDRIVLEYQDNNTEAFDRLLRRWLSVLKRIQRPRRWLPTSLYLAKKIPLAGVAHQVGTCRFGTDPKSSVLDTDCRAHEVRNLYVVDGSFFPSSSAVNPSLTIMANALRVGDRIKERMGFRTAERSALAAAR
jgi:choline dehydrogenase-like flavoprotein